MKRDLYAQMAVPLKGRQLRDPSMSMLAMALTEYEHPPLRSRMGQRLQEPMQRPHNGWDHLLDSRCQRLAMQRHSSRAWPL